MIITIGRQFGSGGREIGEKVAKRLGYAFYDKEILTMAAEESGFSPAAMQHYDERPSGSLIYSLYMTGAATSDNLPLNQQLAFAQFNIIRKVAQADNCVIVGRCADYILKDRPDCLHIFIHADMEHRAARVRERYGETKQPMEKRLQEKDSKRKIYYKHYTNRNWGEAQNYHLCLNSGLIGVDKCTDIICDVAEMV